MAASRPSRHLTLVAPQSPPSSDDNAADDNKLRSSRSSNSLSTLHSPHRPWSRTPDSFLSTPYTPLHIRTNSPTIPPSPSSLHQRRLLQALSPNNRPVTAAGTRRPPTLPSLSSSLSFLLVLSITAAALVLFNPSLFTPALLVSLVPFLSLAPLPSLAIVSIVGSFPPPTQLNSTDSHLRHAALVVHCSLTFYLHLVPPHHILLLSPSADTCSSLLLYGETSDLSKVTCRTIPVACLDNEYHAPLLPCIMSMVTEQLATKPATYTALVSPGILLAPHLVATLGSLSHSYKSHAHGASSPTSFVLTSRSADVLLPQELLNVEYSQQRTAPTAEQLYASLLAATDRDVASQSVTQPPPRPLVDLLVLPSALLHSTHFPSLAWSDVEVEDAVWRRWLLYHLYTDRHAMVVDATQLDYPLLFHPLLSSPSSPPSTPTTSALLTYNERVATEWTPRLTWQLGLVSHAPYTVSGHCPDACHVTTSPSPSSRLLSLLFHRTAPSNNVMLVEVSDDGTGPNMDDDVDVFVCWARRVKFDAWLMAVRSTATAERLRERGLPVLSFEMSEQQHVHQMQQPAGATEERRYRLWLSELVTSTLRYNVNVILTSAAVIPLSASPFSQLSPATNYHLLASVLSTSTPSSSPSLPIIVVLSATAASLAHSSAQSACLDGTPRRSSDPTDDGWTSCMRLSEGSVALSADHYVDLDDYTSRRLSRHGHIPLLIHTTTSNPHIKPQLLRHWGLAPPSATQCTDTAVDATATRRQTDSGEDEGESVLLQVRVLTFDRTASLTRLLQSLSEVDWHWTAHPSAASAVSTIHIHFVISIDVPTSSSASSSSSSAASIATDWCNDMKQRWPTLSPFTMSCSTLVQSTHVGLVGQWTEIPISSSSNNEVLAVLEDDLVVTRVWFRVVMDELVRFYYQTYDPHLVSLAFQHPYTVVGETSSQPFGTIQPSTVAATDCMSAASSGSSGTSVAERRCYFHYQLIGTWGAVFLPGQYAAFSRWLHATERNFSHVRGEAAVLPCVPSLLSNAWWQRRHDAVWSVWIIRYMYERGLYSLYSTTTAIGRNDSVVVNMREVGENFKEQKGATNTPLLEWPAADVEQLYTRVQLHSEIEEQRQREGGANEAASAIALYDFHFRRIAASDVDSLRYRAVILPASEFDQCWTRADRKKLRNAAPTATKAVD